jgi:hypothetical protein
MKQAVLWLVGGAAAAVLAFAIGRALHPPAESAFAYDTSAPAYGTPASVAATSDGGFTGFGGSGPFEGATIVSGRVTGTTADTISIESAGGIRSTLRSGAGSPLRRIEAAPASALQPGVSVIVRRDGDDAVAVLVVEAP